MLTMQSHITAASGTVLNAPYPAFCVSRTTSAYVPFCACRFLQRCVVMARVRARGGTPIASYLLCQW